MFKDVIIGSISTKLKVKKGLIMILSCLFHSTIIFAVLVGPLFEIDSDFSEVKVVDVFLTRFAPHVPKPITGRRPERSSQHQRRTPEKSVTQEIGKLIAPIEIPEFFEDEELDFNETSISCFGPDIEGITEVEGLENIIDTSIINILNPKGIKRISVKQAKRIKYIAPLYPKFAIDARIKSIVIIEARTDVFGNVVSWKVISGHPLLNGAAINAIKRWKYEPYIVGGIPKSVAFTVTINFTFSK